MDRDDRKQNEPVRRQARQAAEHLKEATRDGAERLAEKGRTQARESVGSVSRALRAAGDALRDEDEGRMSDWSSQAADQIDRLAGYIDRKEYNELLGDVRRFARERPALFLGGMFVTGMLAGRFLRAKSPQRRYEQEQQQEQEQEGSEGYGEARFYAESSTLETASQTEPYTADPIIDVENPLRRGDV